MSTTVLNGLMKVTQSGERVVTLEAPVNYFLNFTRTDTLDTAIKVGYQRPTDERRAKKIAQRIHKTGIVPPVLGNIRDDVISEVLVLSLNGTPATQPGHVKVHIPDHIMAELIDGGHRRMGYQFYVDQGLDSPTDTVTVFLRLGLSQKGEAEEFMVVNSTAHKVTPSHRDYIESVLSGLSEDEAREKLTPVKFREWKAVQVTNLVSEYSDQWADDMIHLTGPNSPQRITLSAFRVSLKELIASPSTMESSVEDVSDILCAYWNAIEEVFPMAFEGGQDRIRKWSLQGGPGVNGFHQMLPMLLWEFQSTGENPHDSATYVPYLKRLTELTGMNSYGDEVTGLDFFLRGRAGAIGMYSSKAAYPRLAENMFRIVKG